MRTPVCDQGLPQQVKTAKVSKITFQSLYNFTAITLILGTMNNIFSTFCKQLDLTCISPAAETVSIFRTFGSYRIMFPRPFQLALLKVFNNDNLYFFIIHYQLYIFL